MINMFGSKMSLWKAIKKSRRLDKMLIRRRLKLLERMAQRRRLELRR
jgi:hypothetical protein